jgi:hypothetical protein
MENPHMKRPELRILTVILGSTLFLLTACAPAPAPDRAVFAVPEEAAKALMKGLKTNDAQELKAVFGPNVEKDLSSGDPVADRYDRQTIALAMEQSWQWGQLASNRMELIIGAEKWPLPVPLAKVRGGWQFDTDAGADEMIARRIGRNELRAIDVCRDYVSMQKEYASQPRDARVSGLYAQKFMSTPGRQEGLYWSVGDEEAASPLGDIVAQAAVEGYAPNKDSSEPLWGYHFRIVTAQGAAAKGGAKSYIVDGEMSGGFALIAYPAEYGRGGIMTFAVNQDGVVYQKDLGDDTPNAALKLNEYNPDGTWAEVKAPPAGKE